MLRAQYGITPEQYDEMVERQAGACALCRRTPPTRLHVDHDHETGRVRGLLCGTCNRALGILGDTPTSIAAVQAYVSGI